MNLFCQKIKTFFPPHALTLIILVFLNQLLWTWVIPFNQAPDEWAHLESVNRILNHTYFSTSKDFSKWIIQGYGQVSVSYALLPPLPYILAAGFTLFSNFGSHVYQFGRLGSVMSMTALVYLVYLFFQKLGTDKWRAYLGASVVGFIPQLTFLGAYINSDALSLMLSILVVVLAIDVFLKDYLKYAHLFSQGLLVGLAMLTRYNIYPLLLASGFLIFFTLIKHHKLKYFILYLLGIILVGGWWFGLGWIRGDITGVNKMYQLLKFVRSYEFRHIGVLKLLLGTDWLWVTFKSSFAAFDWNSLFLPKVVYLMIGAGLMILFFSGMVRFAKLSEKFKVIFITLAGSALLTMLQTIFQSAYGSYQPQGRHWLAAELCLFIFLLYLVLGKTKKLILMILLSLASLGVNIYCLGGILIPKYWASGFKGFERYKMAFYEMTFQKPWLFSKMILFIVMCFFMIFLLIHLVSIRKLIRLKSA